MDKFLVRDKLLKWTQDDKQILKSPVSTINTSVVRNTAKRKTPGFMSKFYQTWKGRNNTNPATNWEENNSQLILWSQHHHDTWTRRGQYIQEKLKTNIPHEQDKKKKQKHLERIAYWLKIIHQDLVRLSQECKLV